MSQFGRGGNCFHCGGPKPCKPCTFARQQRWADANRERVRQQKDKYNQANPELVVASKKRNYEANKAEYKRRAKLRRASDPQARRDEERSRYARDPKPFIVRNKRREERDRAVGGRFTQADRCALFVRQQGMCANPYCEADLSITGFHADHVKPVLMGGSHDISNRQLLCPTCNHRKGALSNEQWLTQQQEENAA